MKKIIIVCVAMALLLTSCVTNSIVYTKDLLENAQDADSAFRQIVRENRIIFIGSEKHILTNFRDFLDKNTQMLYDEGVRYIFAEGSEPPEGYVAPPLLATFYPWFPVGIGYSGDSVDAVEQINNTKEDDDKIKTIMLEKGRDSFALGVTSTLDIYKYRSALMFENFQEGMKTIEDDAKILVIAGNIHGAIEETTWFGGIWKPLGAYIKEAYGDDYFAIDYKVINEELLYLMGYSDVPGWDTILERPTFLTHSDMESWAKELPIRYNSDFDGYIVEKQGRAVIPYEYAVFDNDVVESMVSYLEYLDEKVAEFNGEYDYSDGDMYYLLGDYLRVTYYLKLYFCEQFEYDLWNPETTLKVALEDLREKATGNNFTDMVTLKIPDKEGLREYKLKMDVLYLTFVEMEFGNDDIAGKILSDFETDVLELQKLIPQDLWTMYWFALMHTKAENYDVGLDYWEALLRDPVAKSMHIYPEVLEFASLCAKELGDENLAKQYMQERETLWNERNIDVSVIGLVE